MALALTHDRLSAALALEIMTLYVLNCEYFLFTERMALACTFPLQHTARTDLETLQI